MVKHDLLNVWIMDYSWISAHQKDKRERKW